MAHLAQMNFFLKVKQKFPQYFKNVSVLDIGSLDINGNNRYLFENYSYIGIDLGVGNNVDVVSLGHEYKSDNLFDVVISSECFEHDSHYNLTILNAISLTKSNGLFTFTCASTGRPEHGTSRTTPKDSPFSHLIFSDYYKNLTEADIREFLNCDEIFKDYCFEFLEGSDLYFYGIKK